MHIRLFVLQQIHLPALQGLSQATGSLHLCMLSIFNRLDNDNQTGAALCSYIYICIYATSSATFESVFFFLLVRLCTCKVILIS